MTSLQMTEIQKIAARAMIKEYDDCGFKCIDTNAFLSHLRTFPKPETLARAVERVEQVALAYRDRVAGAASS